jgi:hypothetical protein
MNNNFAFILHAIESLYRGLKITTNSNNDPPPNNDHLSTTTIILVFRFPHLEYKGTTEQRPPVNNGNNNFEVPMVRGRCTRVLMYNHLISFVMLIQFWTFFDELIKQIECSDLRNFLDFCTVYELKLA